MSEEEIPATETPAAPEATPEAPADQAVPATDVPAEAAAPEATPAE